MKSSQQFLRVQYYIVYAWLLVSALAFGAPAADEEDVYIEDVDQQQQIYCPGYRSGNPILATTGEGCRGGPELGVVDHMYAFGINQTEGNPDWSACGIPTLPSEK